MDANAKKAWLTALRSGEYQQCRGTLATDVSYCCLGVLAKIQGALNDENNAHQNLYFFWKEDVRLTDDERATLVNLNDIEMKSFTSIAKYIEFFIPADEPLIPLPWSERK